MLHNVRTSPFFGKPPAKGNLKAFKQFRNRKILEKCTAVKQKRQNSKIQSIFPPRVTREKTSFDSLVEGNDGNDLKGFRSFEIQLNLH